MKKYLQTKYAEDPADMLPANAQGIQSYGEQQERKMRLVKIVPAYLGRGARCKINTMCIPSPLEERQGKNVIIPYSCDQNW